MNHQSKYNWLLLALTPNIGPVTFLKLIKHFGTPEHIFSAERETLSPFISNKTIDALKIRMAESAADAALKWSEGENCTLLTLEDDLYPVELVMHTTPPPLLFLRGQPELLQKRKIAIVGSRHPTPQGIQNATQFAHNLNDHGFVIVSGLAAGIDSAAHQGTIHGNGETIAFLGTGIDRVYPSSNKKLAHTLIEKGLLVSEFPLGVKPLAQNFPRRNRLIAALTEATLVVEATLESGSLITASLAVQMNKEVMAIPGSIHNPQSKGCHKLIKEGAKLVESVEDILTELPDIYPNPNTTSNFLLSSPFDESAEDTTTSVLLTTMGFDPVHPDLLAQQLQIETSLLYEQLLMLELAGKIKSTTGGRFQRLF